MFRGVHPAPGLFTSSGDLGQTGLSDPSSEGKGLEERPAQHLAVLGMPKAQGKTAKQALVVVAVKLLHAVYVMLKHRQPYNPSRLLVAPATIGS